MAECMTNQRAVSGLIDLGKCPKKVVVHKRTDKNTEGETEWEFFQENNKPSSQLRLPKGEYKVNITMSNKKEEQLKVNITPSGVVMVQKSNL